MQKVSLAPFALLSLVALVGACSSSMTGELERRHVHNGTEKSGTVVYNPHGATTLVEGRRREAYGRAVEYCAPQKFEITQEQNLEPKQREPNYNGPANTLGMRTLAFVDFKCMD